MRRGSLIYFTFPLSQFEKIKTKYELHYNNILTTFFQLFKVNLYYKQQIK